MLSQYAANMSAMIPAAPWQILPLLILQPLTSSFNNFSAYGVRVDFVVDTVESSSKASHRGRISFRKVLARSRGSDMNLPLQHRSDRILLDPSFAYHLSLKISDGDKVNSTLFFLYYLFAEEIIAESDLVYSLCSDSITALRYCARAALQS